MAKYAKIDPTVFSSWLAESGLSHFPKLRRYCGENRISVAGGAAVATVLRAGAPRGSFTDVDFFGAYSEAEHGTNSRQVEEVLEAFCTILGAEATELKGRDYITHASE